MQIGPNARPGQRIGLLGGSFDPPHEGHVHITRWALRRFRLDQVWWLVSPGNPLKDRGPAPIETRMAAAEAMFPAPGVPDYRIEITDIEAHLGTRYTAETLKGVRRLYPSVRFTWLMGADNLATFHLWQDWRWIMESFPVGVLGRPGSMASAGLSPAARRYRRHRIPKARAARLPSMRAPAWTMLTTGRMSDASSTAIRSAGGWP
ncbi:MAG: nicotinate-nucleotide adenylyltransferase [Pseudomonadota bacterium]